MIDRYLLFGKMKALTMADLKKKGEVPLSPREQHQRDTGTGNYNRFSSLAPQSPSSKRKLDPDPTAVMKNPRLDSNVVFDQLREVEDNLSVVKSTVAVVMSAGDSVFNIADGGLGAAVHKLALAVDMLVSNQEKLLSVVVDSAGSGGTSRPPSYAVAATSGGGAGGGSAGIRKSGTGGPLAQPPAGNPREKKIRQAILKAEKSTVIYNAELGNVPVMNRDTLARKVTILLHEKARSEGEYKDNPKCRGGRGRLPLVRIAGLPGQGDQTLLQQEEPRGSHEQDLLHRPYQAYLEIEGRAH